MKKIIMLLTILCFLIFAGQGGAAVGSRSNYFYYPNNLANVTGTVVATGRNFIRIYDEENKRVERFVYLEQGELYNKGDYIRIYYHPQGAIVATIKRMTILEYNKNGQNLGNIFHQASP